MTLLHTLTGYFPKDRIKTLPIELHAWASDAGFYQLIPQAIVFPVNSEDIRFLFQTAALYDVPLTFRTAGTSLSGQSVTDGILVDLSRHWSNASVSGNGDLVITQPGITGAGINQLLKKYDRKIGPDPASINAAMMGGILSNNSSGMCCGVTDNSYHTLHSLQFILPDGKTYDTGLSEAYQRFELESPDIYHGIRLLREQVFGNAELVQKIRRKYRIKNTVGYGINAFLDYEHPLDILAHLLIGAEGTLGFIAEAVLKTIPDKPFKKTGLLFFESPKAACEAIQPLKNTGVEALEFMDRKALRSIELMPDAPLFIRELPDGASCILCEYQADDPSVLSAKFEMGVAVINSLKLVYQTVFTTDPAIQALYWKLRKGMYPSVAAVRAKGSSVMLEDVAVPVDKLGEAITDLQQLFIKYGYHDAIVFGHAKEGNLHFLVSQSTATAAELLQFEQFNDDLANLIVHNYNGSLKAEHGTGRQIAPYVELEWGPDGYAVMQSLKKLIDPNNILNRGVIINADKKCHIKNIKSLPVVEEEVDKCVECGYCEHKCPSREFTLSPRQRIVLRRTLSRLKNAGEKRVYRSILKDYQHYGMDTCAVDGMCATECPVHINTGDLVKRLRKENHDAFSNHLAMLVARHFGTVESLVKCLLRAGNTVSKILGKSTLYRFSSLIRKLIPAFPVWMKQLTKPIVLPAVKPEAPAVIYFPCCMNRMMGADMEKPDSIADAMLRVSAKAEIQVEIPADIKGHCCGQAFASKGFTEAYRFSANRMVETIWQWTKEGSIPLVMDISSCTHSLTGSRPILTAENQQKFDRITILDSISYAADLLLPALDIPEKKQRIIMHPVCSVHKMNLQAKLDQIGKATAIKPVIPIAAGCCGMAGDRGFYYPGLIATATHKEAAEVNTYDAPDCYSTSKPCEMSLTAATGKQYRSVFYLLDEVSVHKL